MYSTAVYRRVMTMKPSAVEVNQLTVSYDQTSALWDVSFCVPEGKMVGVIGPNGAGKSSLLKAMVGLVKPLSGKTLFFGEPFKKVRKRIAYIPQKGAIDWEFPITVFDVVLMGRYGHLPGLKWYRKADRAAAHQILKLLEMDHLQNRQISELSGGQQQRLFIARALMQDADLFLLDEPFSGVDQSTEKMIIDILKGLKNQGKTLMIVHHDLETVEEYFDSVLMIKTSLVAHGDVAEVFNPETLKSAFEPTHSLFDEVLSLSQKKSTGLRS